METIIEIFKLGIVGLIAGLFSSYISNRDHRSKKWWELRVEAYQEVIKALSDLFYYFDSHLTAELEYRKLDEEFKQKLRKFWDESYHKIRQAADAGAFLFSDDVNSALRNFISKQEENFDTPWEYYDSGYAGAKKCLETIVNCSKKDLQIN